jgi:hypothetical protein
MRGLFFVGSAAALLFAACVADDPSTASDDTANDGGSDATTGGDGSTSIGDASSDAPTGPCDPTTPFGAAISLDALNGSNRAAYIRLSADGLFAFYDAPTADAGANNVDDIFQASRATLGAEFSTPIDIATLGGNNSIGTPTITGDGLILYYAYVFNGANPRIGLVTRASNSTPFIIGTVPRPANPPVDGNADASFPVSNSDPFVRQDGQELYFASNRLVPDAGGLDIFRGTSPDDGGFVSADALAELGNTHSERTPVVSPDGLLLYYSTEIRPDGGAETNWTIYRASRATTSDSFGNITRVEELAIDQDTYPDYIAPDLCTIYFHRAAAGGTAISLLYKAVKTP